MTEVIKHAQASEQIPVPLALRPKLLKTNKINEMLNSTGSVVGVFSI